MPDNRALTEQAIDDALMRITSADGRPLGTGFAVGPDLILTCNHVIHGCAGVRVSLRRSDPVEAIPIPDADLARLDLALLRCTSHQGRPLPLELDGSASREFWTKGHHYGDRGFTAAVPIEGRVSGLSGVAYGGYDLPEVMTLTGDQFSRGASGAPLFDTRTGVVVGVITTYMEGGTLRGTGIPLGYAAAASRQLAQAIDHNRSIVPRLGLFTNGPGAQHVCSTQVASALEAFARLGMYVPKLYTRRLDVESQLEHFLDSPAKVMVVGGYAGAGKSSFLGHAAEARRDRALLVRGMDIADATSGLKGVIERTLARVEMPLPGAPDADALVSAKARSDEPLVVFLDALNEATTITASEMTERWIPATTAWMAGRRVKLVLTCRTEYWSRVKEAFRPGELFKRRIEQRGSDEREDREAFERAAAEAGDVFLGSFTDAELTDALEKQGIRVETANREALRHPMMLRMFVESLEESEGIVAFRRPALLDRFVKSRCTAIANRQVPAVAPGAVRNMLSDIAKETFRGGGHETSSRTFFALTASRATTAAELFNETLLFEHADRVRFTFDEVAEFLEAEHFDLDELMTPDGATATWERGALGTAVYAMLLAERGNQTVVRKILKRVIDGIVSRAELRDSDSLIVTRFFEDSSEGERYISDIRIVVDATARGRLPAGTAELVERMLARAPLLTGDRLALIKRVLPAESGYGWREKDIERRDWTRIDSPIPPGDGVARAIREAPKEAFAVLLEWLGDDTTLRGHEATIGSFAACALFEFRSLWMKALLDALVRMRAKSARFLLRELAIEEPDLVLASCDEWALERDAVVHDRVLAIAWKLMDSHADRVRSIAAHVADGGASDEVRASAVRLLFRLGDRSQKIWKAMSEAFGNGEATLFDLSPAFATDWVRIERMLMDRIRATDSFGLSIGAGALGSFNSDVEIQRAIVRLLRFVLEKIPDKYWVGGVCEIKLYDMSPEMMEASGLLRFIDDLIDDGNPQILGCIGLFAGGDRSGHKRDVAARLRTRMLDANLDVGIIARLFDQLLVQASLEDVKELLPRFAAKMESKIEGAVIFSVGVIMHPERITDIVQSAPAFFPITAPTLIETLRATNDARQAISAARAHLKSQTE